MPQADSGSEEEKAIAMSNILFENIALLSGSNDVIDIVEPTTFQELWNHPDPIQREKWRTSIVKYGVRSIEVKCHLISVV